MNGSQRSSVRGYLVGNSEACHTFRVTHLILIVFGMWSSSAQERSFLAIQLHLYCSPSCLPRPRSGPGLVGRHPHLSRFKRDEAHSSQKTRRDPIMIMSGSNLGLLWKSLPIFAMSVFTSMYFRVSKLLRSLLDSYLFLRGTFGGINLAASFMGKYIEVP